MDHIRITRLVTIIKCLVYHAVYCISLSCLLSFLCNPYIPFLIYEIFHLLVKSCIIGRAGASPPSRTAAIIFLYIYIYIYLFIYLYPCRTSCPKSSTCFVFSDISIFLRRKCYTRFFFSHISIFPNLYAMSHGFVSLAKEVSSTLIVTLESEEVLFIEL